MPKRVDSSSFSRTPLLGGQETSSSSPAHRPGAQPTLTRSFAGLPQRASPERSPGPQGMAPRGALANLSAPRPDAEGRRVGFAPRNMAQEANGEVHSETMVFARNDVAPRGGKAPQEVERDVYDQPMVFARRDRPTSDGKAPLTGPGAGPSSPKPRGLFGKLFGGSKAGKSTGSSNDFQQVRLDRPKPASARPGVRLESSGPSGRQDALNRFTGALADFMGSEIADKHKRSVEAAVLHSNSSGALKKALAAAAYLNVDERQLAAVTGLAKANKDLKGDLTDVEVILRRN